MVLVNALCALNLVSSALLNGACCCYQMHEEDERRKKQEAAIQRAIRNEMDIHRQKDTAYRQRQTIISHYQAERRRKLMTQKQLGVKLSGTDSRHPPHYGTRSNATMYDSGFIHLGKSRSSSHHKSPVSFDTRDEVASEATTSTKHRRHNSQATQQSELSSLFDACSLDEEDLEEIALE